MYIYICLDVYIHFICSTWSLIILIWSPCSRVPLHKYCFAARNLIKQPYILKIGVKKLSVLEVTHPLTK